MTTRTCPSCARQAHSADDTSPWDCPYCGERIPVPTESHSAEATERYEIIDLIESLQAELAASQRRAQDARNELCLKCGRYHEAHNGACNGCRWKE